MATSEPPAAPSQRAFALRLHRIYGGYALGVIVFVGVLALLERRGWPRAWIGATFLVATIGVYAVIGLICRTTDETEYFVAGRRVPALYNGMATAADWMSVASFIGTAGVLYLQGFDGLAYILGWTGGYCLVALLLSPYLRRFGQYTIPDFLGARYGGTLPRLIGAAAAVLVSSVYLVVQLYGVGLITSHLTGFSFEIGIFVGLGGVLVCSFLGGMRAVTWTQVAQYIVLILAYTVPVVWLSVKQTGNPVAVVAYGQQLQRIAEHERQLLDDPAEHQVAAAYAARADAARRKLADVPAAMQHDAQALRQQIADLRVQQAPLAKIQQLERRLAGLPRDEPTARAAYERERADAQARARPLGGLPPHAGHAAGAADSTAGAQLVPDQARAAHDDAAHRGINFIALILCLMVGTAAMPHILVRSYTTASVVEARRSVAWALFFITLLYLMAPALAAFIKHEVLSGLVGQPIEQLPGWIRRWSRLDAGLVSVEDINADGLLQFAELHLSGDVIVLAAPEIGGLPNVVTYLVAAGGLAAALSTADGLLLTISNALTHDVFFRVLKPRTTVIRRILLAKLMVLLVALVAAWLASLRATNILPLVATAFSLAASAFFPALVLGIFWRRTTHWGACAGMLAGLGMCLAYIGSGLGGGGGDGGWRWFGVEPVAAGVFAVPFGLVVAVLVSLLDRPPPAAQTALVDRLRRPG